MKAPKLAVVGVPTAAGARRPSIARAPLALRDSGLLAALAADGTRVVNLSDLSLFPHREDDAHPRARNAAVVACAVRTASDEMSRALDEGFTLVLGGDCTVAAGVAAGIRAKLGQEIGIIYLDGHADLHTPETTASGYLEGMALALALGQGPEAVVSAGGPPPAVRPERVALLGVRDWEAGEPERAKTLALTLSPEEMQAQGMAAVAACALEAVGPGPVMVHLDLDIIRTEEMPAVEVPTPGGGLTLLEAAALLRALLHPPRVVALTLVEYDPDRDPDRVYARKVVDLVASALARRGV
jgi:arginase